MSNQSQRNYVVGDHWLYYKIYTGFKTSDSVLTEVVKKTADILIEKKIINKWFFIRYADPDHHLRVRFFLIDRSKIGEVIVLFYQLLEPFLQQELVWNVQIDTYKREIERYGNDNIKFSEQLFYVESNMIVKLLELIEGDLGEEIRWLFGMKAIDNLLTVFGNNEFDKLNILENLKNAFNEEFAINKSLKKQLDSKYRNAKAKIGNFMAAVNSDPDYADLKTILDEKDKLSIPIIKDVMALRNNNQLEIDLHHLLSSYIHMIMNRLFRADNRLHEMIIYNFLFQVYKSSCARQKYEQAK